MTVTGQVMVLFIIAHVIGNSTIYFQTLNAYAAGLHVFPLLVWAYRGVMSIILAFHIYLGIVLTLENWSAKPDTYAVTNRLSTTFAGRTMIWTGSVIGAFLIYHLLHFTVQIIDPGISALLNPDALGRPDVYQMVVRSLQNAGTAVLYLLSLTALMLHLSHGIQSSFQTDRKSVV
jgi:succinate dehydrogenase / fumarate reductase cytochrome b subunit